MMHEVQARFIDYVNSSPWDSPLYSLHKSYRLEEGEVELAGVAPQHDVGRVGDD